MIDRADNTISLEYYFLL